VSLLEFFNYFDPVLLSRIQFAFTISFHIIFPAFTIGLASYLATLEFLWLRTRNSFYQDLYKFWVKIFAVTFGMGVVSGVVMSYEFGTNWAPFADKIGNVLGPLLGYEVLTAFFLEASFLGIMLFGWGKVSERMHFASTLIVAVGTLISAFWILSANSFMHTPQGFVVDEIGRLKPTSWLEIIFNPSFPYRYLHMVLASYITTALVVGAVASYYLLKGFYKDHAKIMLNMATLMIVIVAPIQAIVGDLHGLNTLEHQPVKISAMEGIWDTEKGAGLKLFGIPNASEEKTEYAFEIPKLASLILTHDLNGEVKGLKEWPKEERPPVAPVFFSFRIMVGIGMLTILLGVISAYAYFTRRLYNTKFIQYFWIAMSPAGFIAILTGWMVAEIGRQPYIVYGILKTATHASNIPAAAVLGSLIAFFIVYSFVFGMGIYYILKLIRKGIYNKEQEYYKVGVEASVLETHNQGVR
jgi:cytochrome bd ubiquinol oxidase subunit I